MTVQATLSPSIRTKFGVSSFEFVAGTDIANIWKVDTSDYGLTALKVYHGGNMANEATGFDVLTAAQGVGAIHIHTISNGSVLMEWLDGPSLGDLVRSGGDIKAALKLVEVANQLHMAISDLTTKLPNLETWFDGMFQLEFSDDLRLRDTDNFNRCKRLAEKLFITQRDIVPLHGDLHHDNIKLGSRGYLSFDAKGVCGERTYELANAFRNPKGADDLVRNPERMKSLAKLWAKEFDVDYDRLLKWAVVKCAWSISLRANGKLKYEGELDLLDTFMKVAKV